ncbi:hypothetical protein ACLOJK_029560 [Asimina triloba]
MQCSNPTAHRQMAKSFKPWPMSNRNYRATHPTIESRKPNPSHQQLTFISPSDRLWPADQHRRPAASGSASSGSPDHPASSILEWQAEISAHSLHQHHGSEIKRPNSKSRAPISNEQPCHSQIIQPQAASDGHIQSHDHAQIIQSAVHACPAPNPSHNRAANHGHQAGEPKTQTTHLGHEQHIEAMAIQHFFSNENPMFIGHSSRPTIMVAHLISSVNGKSRIQATQGKSMAHSLLSSTPWQRNPAGCKVDHPA